MQFLHILFVILVASVAYSSAQNCRGRPRTPSCSGQRNVGRVCRGCLPSMMWYYDAGSRQCREMRYWGVAGNNNRWCTRASCARSCRR